MDQNIYNFKKLLFIIIIIIIVAISAAVLCTGLAVEKINRTPDETDMVHAYYIGNRSIHDYGASNSFIGLEGPLSCKEMTLDDVRELSARGDKLLFEDLRNYKGENVSINLDYYIMVYDIEGGYRLVVSSKGSGKPNTANLVSVWESGGSGIDIRYNDVDSFLQATP